jgi:hypothetical protein
LLTLAMLHWRFFQTVFLRSFASVALGSAFIAMVRAALRAAGWVGSA